MWGSWFLILFGGLLVVLLLVGIAFGTSALLFPVLIAAATPIAVGPIYGGRRGRQETSGAGPGSGAGITPRRPRGGAAPASGEGSAPQPSEPPPPWQAP
jgi:hypothetical protein